MRRPGNVYGRGKRRKTLTNKQMFIHDLWTDYAKYLRKWVEKIRNFNAEEEPAEDLDAYQEFMDYYIGENAQGEHRSDCAARWRKNVHCQEMYMAGG